MCYQGRLKIFGVRGLLKLIRPPLQAKLSPYKGYSPISPMVMATPCIAMCLSPWLKYFGFYQSYPFKITVKKLQKSSGCSVEMYSAYFSLIAT